MLINNKHDKNIQTFKNNQHLRINQIFKDNQHLKILLGNHQHNNLNYRNKFQN